MYGIYQYNGMNIILIYTFRRMDFSNLTTVGMPRVIRIHMHRYNSIINRDSLPIVGNVCYIWQSERSVPFRRA